MGQESVGIQNSGTLQNLKVGVRGPGRGETQQKFIDPLLPRKTPGEGGRDHRQRNLGEWVALEMMREVFPRAVEARAKFPMAVHGGNIIQQPWIKRVRRTSELGKGADAKGGPWGRTGIGHRNVERFWSDPEKERESNRIMKNDSVTPVDLSNPTIRKALTEGLADWQ